MKKITCCGLLCLAALGCNNGSNTDSGVADAKAAQGASATAQKSTVVTNGAGTEPGEVVALFLDSLRRGDENAANGVLTAQAQAELAKTDFVIQPLGTPEGTYKIGRVGFVDGDPSVCLVECLWSEPSPQAGQQPIELDIVCEVHKEVPGWRISGIAVKMAGTEDALVLDFENAASLQQALEQAGNKPSTPAGTNVANAPAAPGALPGQVPQGQMPQGQLPQGQLQPNQQQFAAPQTNAPQLNAPQFGQAGQQQTQAGQPSLTLPGNVPQFDPNQPQQPSTQIALPPTTTLNR